MKIIVILFTLFFNFVYAQQVQNMPKIKKNNTPEQFFLQNLLKQYPDLFTEILEKRNPWNVQIIYTQVNRDVNNVPTLSNHYFNVDNTKYF